MKIIDFSLIFDKKTIFGRKIQKIENPRQSSYKDPIKGDFYKNQTKKSSIA